MKKFLCIYDKIVNALTWCAGVVAGGLVMAVCFMIVYEIVARGVFHSPTEWVTEISTYCIVISGFLGMGVTWAGKKHIRVDIVTSHLSPKTQCALEAATSLFVLYFCYLFVTESWGMTMMSLEYDNCAPTTLGTPLWIPQVSMPIGMLILAFQVIGTILHDTEKCFSNELGKEETK